MSWRDIVKLSEKQKKLDTNHNGVIDAQDFHIMNGSKEMEKLSWSKEQCEICGNMFPNKRALQNHIQSAHSGSKSNNAFTARN